jgi:hypothetical protein
VSGDGTFMASIPGEIVADVPWPWPVYKAARRG